MTGALMVRPGRILEPFSAWKRSPAQNVICTLSGSVLPDDKLSGTSYFIYIFASVSVNETISQLNSIGIGSSETSEETMFTSTASLISKVLKPFSVK